MDKHRFIQLLDKYLKGNASDEEKRFIISYYNHFDVEPGMLGAVPEEQKEQLAAEIRSNIWQNIDTGEHVAANKISLPKRLPRLAAAAVFIMLSIGAVIFFSRTSPAKPAVVHLNNLQKENRLIHLPDGSTVIINVGATLTYPTSFDKLSRREVYLEGEAFFDISHDPAKPFIVHTGKVATTVLGTAFNIKALPGDEDVTVTVTRGKVRISDSDKTLGLLTRGQQIIYNKAKKGAVQNTTAGDKLNWKLQDIFLDDVTLEDAAKLLEERFNVNISIEETDLRNSRFTTVFLKNEGLEQVLKSICEFNSASYNIDIKSASITISRISNPNN